MIILLLEGTEDSPEIVLDKAKGIFKFSGRSLPEDASAFYSPVLEWIGEYSQSPNPSTEFVFKFEYFNTASTKVFQEIINALSKIPGIKITWYFDKGDKTTEETLTEYAENSNIPFEMIRY